MNSALRAIVMAATTVTLVGSTLIAPARAAAPVELQPEDLSRGADIAIPHIEDGDFVDGDRRVDVGGGRAFLLGRAGRAWLVGTSAEDGGTFRIVRVKRDDTTTVIKRGISFFELKLSENGRFFVHAGRGGRNALPIRVFSSRTGDLKVERDFANYPEVLGMDGPRVLLSTWTTGDTGITSWDTGTDTVSRISRRPANIIDIDNDLLATYTKDPYLGGCTVLSTLSSPRTRLWKSCSERIEAVSPDGDRMATVHILSDGIGPGQVRERQIDGSLLGDYTTNWFGRIGFETDTDLLLEVNGDTRAATVRCSERSCENATDPVAVQQPRTSSSRPVRRDGSVAPAAGAWQRD